MTSHFEVKNSPPTLLITGCSTGIGHSTAELFAKRGWRVFAGSRNPDGVKFSDANIHPIKIDVNDPASVDHCFGLLKKQRVDLDCVVNNAGYGLLLPFEDTPEDEIRKLFEANVFGLMRVSKHAAALMRERRSGVIINISSVLGTIGAPWYTVYGASKWAVEGFSESLAHELRPFNVRVKIVEPSGTRTEFHHVAYDTGLSASEPYRTRYERKRSSHARGNSGYDSPESIAELIFAAATDTSQKIRYSAPEARRILWWQRVLGRDGLWRRLAKRWA